MATADSAGATRSQSGGGAGEGGASGGAALRSNFLSGFGRMDLLRQMGLLIALAASVALGFSVVLWSQSEDFQPLYGNMQGYNTSELINVLDAEGIRYRMDPGSGIILVPSDRVSQVRLQIASAGVSRDNGYGYEFLDEDQGLGTSQFMEMNRYRRSQEGELQRTITGLRNVQAARVHLATPERSVFMRNSRKPTASVLLTLTSSRGLSETQVQAIANLVASSVPEMEPEDVTIVDQQGNLLTRKREDSNLTAASERLDYVRRYEDTLSERITRILQPIVGPGRFTAEVSADIDFTRTEQAAEQFNPEVQVLRSEQSLLENRTDMAGQQGIPGALTNQPPVDAQVPENAEQAEAQVAQAAGNSREQATRNYEVDRTISYTNFDPVSVRRLSVAVVIDDGAAVAAGAETWSENDLDRVRALVRDAIGFSAERGDSVTVLNQRFASLAQDEPISMPFWQEPWVASALRQFLAGLFVLVLAFGVLLPVLRKIASGGNEQRKLSEKAGEGEFADLNLEGMGDESVTLRGSDDAMLPGPDDSYERQLSSVRGMVAQDPARVAQVVKHWIDKDG